VTYNGICKKAQKKKFFTPPSPGHIMALATLLVVSITIAVWVQIEIANKKEDIHYQSCKSNVSSTADLTLVTINGTQYRGKVTPLPGSGINDTKEIEFEMHIPGADEIIDIDVVDLYNLKISYRIGERVILLSVPRQAFWDGCDAHVWISQLSALPAAPQSIQFSYPR
jgi:hypothetical protein